MSFRFPDPVHGYDALMRERPDLFRNRPDGYVDIVTEAAGRQELEAELSAGFAERGMPEHWAYAGKFYEDPWLMLVRDVVTFSGSGPGTYHRVLLKDGADSVVTVPRYENTFVLVNHFRHALRDWSLELPRGHVGKDKTVEEAATAELREEIGAEGISVRRIGLVQSDTSLAYNPMHVCLAEVASVGEPGRQEGIRSLRRVTLDEFRSMVGAGEITDVLSVAALSFLLLEGEV